MPPVWFAGLFLHVSPPKLAILLGGGGGQLLQCEQQIGRSTLKNEADILELWIMCGSKYTIFTGFDLNLVNCCVILYKYGFCGKVPPDHCSHHELTGFREVKLNLRTNWTWLERTWLIFGRCLAALTPKAPALQVRLLSPRLNLSSVAIV